VSSDTGTCSSITLTHNLLEAVLEQVCLLVELPPLQHTHAHPHAAEVTSEHAAPHLSRSAAHHLPCSAAQGNSVAGLDNKTR
jgi:hypothetical protein